MHDRCAVRPLITAAAGRWAGVLSLWATCYDHLLHAFHDRCPTGCGIHTPLTAAYLWEERCNFLGGDRL